MMSAGLLLGLLLWLDGGELLDLTFCDTNDGVLDIAERLLESKEKVFVGPSWEELTDHFELNRVFGTKGTDLFGIVLHIL